jgi:proliferating cell nuclear antigen
MSCEGDTDDSNLKLLKGKDLESLEVPSMVHSLFPLDYFSNLLKAIPAGTKIKVELDSDYPVKLVFGLANDEASVMYFLAPRIESD